MPTSFPPELSYVLLLFALFVVPRFLQRYRLPAAVTSFALGGVSGMGFGLFQHDATIEILSALGIASLFLFAGLEVDFGELRKQAPFLVQHLVIRVLLLAGGAWLVHRTLGLEMRPASLVALALFTPSTGFILDSLASLEVTPRERFWIKSKAIATELLALGVLFATLQSVTAAGFALSTAMLVALVLALPLVFRAFAKSIVCYAPKSEFAFLLMIAILAAFATRALGAYYLVGAFVVGVTAQRFREELPAMASEQMLHAVEVFASFFVPFYFFHAGSQLRAQDVSIWSLLLGMAFVLTAIPLQILIVAAHRRLMLDEPFPRGLRIGASMSPTLVFTLVIAEILRDRFQVAPTVFGALIVYTIADTLVPGFALKLPPPEFESPHAPGLEIGTRDGVGAEENRPHFRHEA
jgi:Kef-type K+ transport system membrane component KefB